MQQKCLIFFSKKYPFVWKKHSEKGVGVGVFVAALSWLGLKTLMAMGKRLWSDASKTVSEVHMLSFIVHY